MPLIRVIIERGAANPKHMAAREKEWAAKSPPDQIKDILKEMDAAKTQYGSIVGEAFLPSLKRLKKVV